MKKYLISILSSLLLVGLISSIAPTICYAEKYKAYYYDVLDDGTASIWLIDRKYVEKHKNFKIPSKIDGHTVTQLEWCFEGVDGSSKWPITVTIPKTVNYLWRNPFQDCPTVKSIKVDKGNETFCSINGVLYKKLDCGRLALVSYPPAKKGNFSIPDNVFDIEEFAFSNVKNLKKLTIHPLVNISGEAFMHANVKNVSMSDFFSSSTVGWNTGNTTNNINRTFGYCDKLKKVDIATFDYINATLIVYTGWDGKTYTYNIQPRKNAGENPIGYEAVLQDGDYTTYASADAMIPDEFFHYCSSLNSVTIGDNIYEIQDYAFAECTNLKSVRISGNITKIGKNAFKNINSKATITIESGDDDYKRIQKLLRSKSVGLPKKVKIVQKK